MRRAETQHKSRRTRVFQPAGARRRGIGRTGAGWADAVRRTSWPSSLRGSSKLETPWHYHCTNHCKMWPLSASAADEVATKAVSIDVPSEYKWVLWP